MSSPRHKGESLRAASHRPRRRGRGWIYAAVILSAMIGLLTIVFKQPPSNPQAEFTSPAERETIACDVERRFKAFEEASRSSSAAVARAQKPPVLEVTEREINAYVQSSPNIQAKLQSSGVSNPSVVFRGGKVIASGTVLFHGMHIPITITGSMAPGSRDSVKLEVESIKAGMVGVPGAVTARVNDMIRSGKLQLPPGVASVTVQDGRIIMIGSSR
jgi:hypothetical protein